VLKRRRSNEVELEQGNDDVQGEGRASLGSG
jgi:hypothetical protein